VLMVEKHCFQQAASLVQLLESRSDKYSMSLRRYTHVAQLPLVMKYYFPTQVVFGVSS